MRRASATLVVLALALLPGQALAANAFDRLYDDFRDDGRINACRYPSEQLERVKSQVPNDIEAYAPDFPAVLDDAIEQRARGGCRRSGGGGASAAAQGGSGVAPGAGAGAAGAAAATPDASPQPAAGGGAAPGASTAGGAPAPAPAGTTPAPAPEAQPAPAADDRAIDAAAARSENDHGAVPAPLVGLAALLLVLALTALLVAAARWWAFEPSWMPRARHAVSEAGWRASGAWSEFSDWVRLGR